MRALGVELVEHGADFQDAVEHAGKLAAAEGLWRQVNDVLALATAGAAVRRSAERRDAPLARTDAVDGP